MVAGRHLVKKINLEHALLKCHPTDYLNGLIQKIKNFNDGWRDIRKQISAHNFETLDM